MKLLGHRVLVELVEEKNAGNFLIPEAHRKERPALAVVKEVGRGRRGDEGEKIPFEVLPGQQVIVDEWKGQWVNERKCKIYDESDILCVLNDNEGLPEVPVIRDGVLYGASAGYFKSGMSPKEQKVYHKKNKDSYAMAKRLDYEAQFKKSDAFVTKKRI